MLLILFNMGAGAPTSPTSPTSSVTPVSPSPSHTPAPPPTSSSARPIQVGAVILDVVFLGRIEYTIDVSYFERCVVDTLDFIRVPVDVSFLP